MNQTSQAAHSVFAIENIYKMIENCVKMECSGCRKLIPTHLFYDHLHSNQCGGKEGMINFLQKSQDLVKLQTPLANQHLPYNSVNTNIYTTHHGNQTYLSSQQHQLFKADDNQSYSSLPGHQPSLMQFFENGAVASTNQDLQTERTNKQILFLEEKLRKADEVLRESAIEIKCLREDREQLQLDRDRLAL